MPMTAGNVEWRHVPDDGDLIDVGASIEQERHNVLVVKKHRQTEWAVTKLHQTCIVAIVVVQM